ncbi:vomeronasal type-1 receptor 45-like [Lepus europaeus]|uniref:vomeronasal type-1 receptor 45-like n=1 Tax=Lepus europaeus TaxID=9983 RepID=UPI002B492F12|nr:vomeronasal type-1 receptor 45-like [Lepus europaeus]
MNTLSADVAINNCILCQAGFGILSNNFLFIHIVTHPQYHKPKLTDLICCHLALVHIIMLLTVLFWRSPDLFESLNFFNDFRCKALFYIIRVMRSLSICTTCFLSIIQAITISSSTSWLAQLKHKSTHLIFFLSLLWFLCLCFSTSMIFYTVANSNVTQTNVMVITKYCSFFPISHSIRGLVFTLITSRDVFLIGVMLLSSVYMVILLLRHQRRSQYLHSTSLSPRSSPEKRATQTILLLVSFFVVMHCVDFIISSSSIMLWSYDSVILGIHDVVVSAYATVSPLVLICSNKRLINFFQKCGKSISLSLSLLSRRKVIPLS